MILVWLSCTKKNGQLKSMMAVQSGREGLELFIYLFVHRWCIQMVDKGTLPPMETHSEYTIKAGSQWFQSWQCTGTMGVWDTVRLIHCLFSILLIESSWPEDKCVWLLVHWLEVLHFLDKGCLIFVYIY